MARSLTTFACALLLAVGLGQLAAQNPPAASAPASGPAETATGPAAATQGTSWLAEILKAHKIKPLLEPIPGGEIDWTNGVVYGVGIGKMRAMTSKELLMAQRAARLVALRNAVLLEAGIRTGPGGRFKDVREGQIDFEAIVNDFQEVQSDYDVKTNSAVSKVKIPLYGPKGLISLRGLGIGRAGKLWAWPSSAAPAAGTQVIIIDARGTTFSPCLLPELVTESGETVFGPSSPPRPDLSARAMAAYIGLDGATPVTELRPSAAEGQAGDAIIVKPARATDRNELVLSQEELKKLEPARPSLDSGKVLIVVGSTTKADSK